MVPVFAVNVHVGSSYAFIMESGSFNEIQRSLIVRQDERFYAVHLILIENKRYGGIQRLCHVSLTGVVLVQMIADAAAHHAAVSKIVKRARLTIISTRVKPFLFIKPPTVLLFIELVALMATLLV